MDNTSARITKRIFEEFVEFAKSIGEFAETVAFTPYGHLSIHSMRVPKTTYYYKLRKFEKAGLIKKDRKKYANNFLLTSKGKFLVNKKSVIKPRNDGFSTIVIFDIPEERGRERTIFRRYLLRNGYTQLQKSALIGPDEFSSDIRQLMDELKLHPFVTIISGKIDYQ